MGSLLFLVTRNLGDGLRLLLAGIALEQVIGVELHYCIVAIGVATIVYTFLGGMRAVIWSDCLQFLIYMTGGAIALWLLIDSFPGGWAQWFEFGEQQGKFQVFDLRAPWSEQFWREPYTVWAGLLGGAVLTLGTHGTDQMMVQRYLSARSLSDARRALVLSGFVVFVQFSLFLALGVALSCFFTEIVPRTFERKDQVFAFYIVEYLPVGFVGITLAAVFAAAMSTLSSSLHSSASAAVNDFYLMSLRRRGRQDPPAAQLLSVSRRLTVGFGVLQIGIGIGASRLSASVVSDALAIAGFSAGVLLGVFLLGTMLRRPSAAGSLVAMLAGITVLICVKFLTAIAWPWYATIGALTTFGTGLIVSMLAPGEPKEFGGHSHDHGGNDAEGGDDA